MLGVEAESITGRDLEQEFHPESTLLHAFKTRRYFTGVEIGFTCPIGHKSFMCSVDPIRDSSGHGIGAIITLAEKRQVISIAKRIGGNYAKYRFEDIKGKDPELLRQMELAGIASKTNSRVLIIGESGTGKELVAQAIHNESSRRNEPFVAISCATIPRDLIESELFGYRGGAFTGARREGQVGKFELANRGTLFLDEVNGLPLDLQAKLLRVLQQNEILRLGDTRPIPIDVRVLAASNCDLMLEVENGGFRKDLYYTSQCGGDLYPSPERPDGRPGAPHRSHHEKALPRDGRSETEDLRRCDGNPEKISLARKRSRTGELH